MTFTGPFAIIYMIGIGDKMKKFGDKNFWIILITSIVVLIGLTAGVIFLTRKSSKEFYDAGYIISSTATKTEKYYFNDNTVYKENVFEEYVFKDVDNKEVSTSKDNFIHYLDNSLSFMKNGVILDLDNFNRNLVPYYNITSKSIIKYNNGSYYIDTADKKLIFGNFLGRITDNKYIVVGNDVKIKLSGNNDYVSGNYFELLFTENGIVKVENNEGGYQTITEGTVIYIGDNIKIDLGTKEVFYEDEAKLTLDEMTIDGNENIDIKAPDNKVNTGSNNNSNENNESNGNQNETDGDKNQGNDGNQTDNNENSTVLKKEVSVNLISASIDINSIRANFQVIDTMDAIKGNLVCTIYDTDHEKTVFEDRLAKTSDLQSITSSSLSPGTNYYIVVKEVSNDLPDKEYFAKSFKTDNLDLILTKKMITTDSMIYTLDLSSDENVKSARVSIYDNEDNLISSEVVNNGETNEVIFDGLKSNSLYKVSVDEVVFKNTNYSQIYTIPSVSNYTLKKKPVIGSITAKGNEDSKTFELSMKKPIDEDNSIIRYVYKIYNADDIEGENTNITPVYSFTANDLKTEILKIGENGLSPNSNYVYKVTTEYYDNYKTNEIDSGYSNIFLIAGRPTIEFVQKENEFNSISGTIKLKDEGCAVPMLGRECYDKANNIYIMYSSGRGVPKRLDINFDLTSDLPFYDLELTDLTENTLYNFEVYGDLDLKDDKGILKSQLLGTFTSSTKGIDALTMEGRWKQNDFVKDNLINVTSQINSTVAGSSIIDKLASFKINLYKGDKKNNPSAELIASYEVTENIKEDYYNKDFNITTKNFGIETTATLKELSGGKLSKFYTIEVADAYNENKTTQFKIIENMFVYKTPAIVLLEDEVIEPEILVREITNEMAKDGTFDKFGIKYDKNIKSHNVVVGYEVTAKFEKDEISKYFQGEPIKLINFYVYNREGTLIESKNIDFQEDENYTVYFPLGSGTDYNIVDQELRRGNTYKFGLDLTLNDDNGNDIFYPSRKVIKMQKTPLKTDPVIKMYIDNSTDNSITYKYTITDYDKALYKEADSYNIHYKVIDAEEFSTTKINNEANLDTFTLSNLVKNDSYNMSYYRANSKDIEPSLINLGNYYFDGYYDKDDYGLNFTLDYQDFSNEIKILLDESEEFLNRVSAYYLRLEAGDLKYEKVISDLSECDDNKCIKVDYKDIVEFKNKDIKVSLTAFYDSGLSGYSQKSLVGNYFKDLKLVDNDNLDKLGYVFQIDNNSSNNTYLYIRNNIDASGNAKVQYATGSKPMGILGFNLKFPTKLGDKYLFDITNIVNMSSSSKGFATHGFIKYNDMKINNNTFTFVDKGIKISNSYLAYPKVLEMADFTSSNNTFKFTSIIPKVKVKVNPVINGATMNIDLSFDPSTLETDFIKTDGKYKFYVDIYDEDNNLVKTVETDYDNLADVTFEGLSPDTKYFYTVAADMNKNGNKVKTNLFDGSEGKIGYIEYRSEFNTLGSNKIYQDLAYNYESYSKADKYMNRKLNFTLYLQSTKNYDVKYQIFDKENNLILENILENKDIIKNDKGSMLNDSFAVPDDFVFGDNSYKIVITAITTDLKKELELYNDYLRDEKNGQSKYYKLFKELEKPNISIIPTSGLDEANNDYSINYNININDTDRTIIDGKVYIELQDIGQNNACPNKEDCIVKVNLKDNTCENSTASTSKVKSCKVTSTLTGSNFNINLTYNKLKSDTNYLIYTYTNAYLNNVSVVDKEKFIYVRQGQYTKSELGFSLGYPILSVKDNELNLAFLNSTDVEKNIVGLKYSVFKEGATNIGSGKIGEVLENNEIKDYGNLNYVKRESNNIYVLLPVNSDISNIKGTISIAVTYYYYDSNNILTMYEKDGNTIHQVSTE